MIWLTSRVAGVASCNVIPYIILPASQFLFLPPLLKPFMWPTKKYFYKIYRFQTMEDHKQLVGFCFAKVICTLIIPVLAQWKDISRFNKCSFGAQVAWPCFLPSVIAPSRWVALNNSWAVRIGIP